MSRVNVVQWNEDLYEEQLIERTKDACGGPVDIVIDFSATSRSIRRALKCLAPVSVCLLEYKKNSEAFVYLVKSLMLDAAKCECMKESFSNQ